MGLQKHERRLAMAGHFSVLVLLPTRELANQDHIEKGDIDLRLLRFRVVDEADEMPRMGFVKHVELILGMELHVEDLEHVILITRQCLESCLKLNYLIQ
ncbi:unnamed protein product [Dovyalis caffra]|uniref:Uncharacterized protein n=1 Tax=Dovyalis caffra TaxID=77055 RepID=A0AAV1STJ7_9ROSI|nr:unnamed protein product [Dovyalis caffra]